MRRAAAAALAVSALAALLQLGTAQICNSADPESGGLWIPAFGTGGAKVCVANVSDPLGLTYVAENNSSLPCVKDAADPQSMWIVYMLLLFYSFAGVGIVADAFMDAITVITSVGRWHATVDPRTGLQQSVHIKRWNPTVANLTLMALGSSAPEIMLSIIEIVAGNYYSGELGPSTIVGSAAFNMLVILAVCVSAPEVGDVRKIRDTNVFMITAFCSVFAYVWLLFILTVHGEGIVDVGEGTLSFLFFPAMVVGAYLADTGFFSSTGRTDASFITAVGTDTTGDGKADTTFQFSSFEAGKILSAVDTKGKPREELAKLVFHAHRQESEGKTRADYRKEGVQALTGKSKAEADAYMLQNEAATAAMNGSLVGFECTQYSCKESVFALDVAVVRVGDTSRKMKISYTTLEDMSAPENKRATEGKDYHKAAGELQFAKGESRKTFEVRMIDDDEVEEDETFLIELSGCSDPRTEILEARQKTAVTIISDDDPGVFVLAKVPDESTPGEFLDFYSASSVAGTVAVLVRREKGSSGAVSVDWRTVAGTATPGTDYGLRTAPGSPGTELNGTLHFDSSISEQYIMIPVLPGGVESGEFKVELFNPQGGAKIGTPEETKRGASGSITVRVASDPEAEKLARDIARLLEEHHDEILSGGDSSWGDQFREALAADENMGTGGLVLFYVNLPWRLLFACIPPPAMAGGWLCFFVALTGIACVTVVVGDLAALLGCSLGLEDSITAITFVALGTSLPDTFASKAATLGDDSADSAIGNVTGSNSVNVFLGLGLPWFIAALYWDSEGATDDWRGRIAVNNPEIVAQNPGGGFAVPAGSLSFSVSVFCACAVMCIATLYLRRKIFGAELGAREPGSIHHTVTSVFFTLLWFFYIAMSVAQTWRLAPDNTLYMIVVGALVLFIVVFVALMAKLSGKYDTSHSRLGIPFDEDGGASVGAAVDEVENPSASVASSAVDSSAAGEAEDT